jgi:hypothetical protein
MLIEIVFPAKLPQMLKLKNMHVYTPPTQPHGKVG